MDTVILLFLAFLIGIVTFLVMKHFEDENEPKNRVFSWPSLYTRYRTFSRPIYIGRRDRKWYRH